MINSYVGIAVGIISYNQEDVISRSLDSILSQREFGLKKVYVFDDCSKDNTQSVVQEYEKNYPGLVALCPNEKNLGIYGNIAVMQERLRNTQEDLIIQVSGDDALCDGFFASLQKCIADNGIDCEHDRIAIYGDWKVVKPNGQEQVMKQDCVLSGEPALDLHIKGRLTNRSSAISRPCLMAFDSFPLDKGIAIAEVFCDLQRKIHSEKNYYIPVVGSIYYSGIGFSTKMNTPKYIKERLEARELTLQSFNLEKTTVHYLRSQIYLLSFRLNRKFGDYFRALWHYVLSKPQLTFRQFLAQVKGWCVVLFR